MPPGRDPAGKLTRAYVQLQLPLEVLRVFDLYARKLRRHHGVLLRREEAMAALLCYSAMAMAPSIFDEEKSFHAKALFETINKLDPALLAQLDVALHRAAAPDAPDPALFGDP